LADPELVHAALYVVGHVRPRAVSGYVHAVTLTE
jgi:hypothetical protein